ncbi:hypothetical protein ACX80L_10175 [Arthrobacter sp. MDT1-48-3]
MFSTSAGPIVPTGILLPESVLHSNLFAILAAFVAINTVIYASLALSNVLPKIYPSDWVTNRNRRAETRGIYPDLQR